jgi:DNA-binding MarR family transcriptional regulator
MRLTDKGRDLIGRIVPIADAFQAEVEARLGEDAAAFRRALARLSEDR